MAKIFVLTGAGVSAESGLETFRDKGGVWSRYDLAEVATPEGFAKDPGLVHGFYNARRRGVLTAEPNAAHRALGELKRRLGPEVCLVTQNVDDLHERGGAGDVVHMHGELLRAVCTHCGARVPHRADLSADDVCAHCGRDGGMRPDVVWFGEAPYEMERIAHELRAAELFVSIGTSGNVYPAAGFVAEARANGAKTLELNLEATSGAFDEARLGVATETAPAWVEEMLR